MSKLPSWTNWLARDANGNLYTYENKPYKLEWHNEWLRKDEDNGKYIRLITDSFDHIKWSDKEPTRMEKEKKYLVEDNHYALLCKFEGKVISTHNSENDDLPIECLEFELTEKEIKDYDDRYWQFAELVEEEEK